MIKEQESFDKLTEFTNFALANQRRAPAFGLTRTIYFVRSCFALCTRKNKNK